MGREIWVLAEHSGGRARKITYELLGKARGLAEALGGRVAAVALGSGLAPLARDLGAHGADRVLISDAPALAQYTTDAYAAVLAPLVGSERPFLLLVGSTAAGRDLAPRLAARLGAGIVTDCATVDLDGERVVVTRPVMTRKAIARVAFRPDVLRIAVVLPNVFPPAGEDPGRAYETVQVPAPAGGRAARTRVLEVAPVAREALPLTEADIIVSGGRGLRGPEHFALLRDLAAALGAAVGSSRPRSIPGGCRTTTRSGRRGRRSTRSCTSRAGSRGRRSTWPGCRAPGASSRSTGTRRPRSSRSRPTGSWATCSRSCRC